MDNDLQRLKSAIRGLNRYRQAGRQKPHQLIMLLAVLDLLDKGEVTVNRFPFDDVLVARFSSLFAAIASLKDRDLPQAAPPFFHLRSSGFWHHVAKPGREGHYAELATSGGGTKRIRDNIDYAVFAEWAWVVVRDLDRRRSIIEYILECFFGEEERYRLTLALHRRAPLSGLGGDEVTDG